METQPGKSINPLMWVAGVAIIVSSVVGVAAMMDWIPVSTRSVDEQFSLAPPRPSANPVAPAQSDAGTPVPASRTPASATCAECEAIESIREREARGESAGAGPVGGETRKQTAKAVKRSM